MILLHWQTQVFNLNLLSLILSSEWVVLVRGQMCLSGWWWLTLVAVGAGESRLTRAAEVPGRKADAAAVRAAHVGRDVPHPFLGVVWGHRDGAAVDHCGWKTVWWVLKMILKYLKEYFSSMLIQNRRSPLLGRCFTFALVGFAVIFKLRAGFAFVIVWAAAVEISHQAVALGLFVTWVWVAGVILDLETEKRRT